jgi:hypothetical protein
MIRFFVSGGLKHLAFKIQSLGVAPLPSTVLGSAQGTHSMETGMPQLRKPLYQRAEGADEDRWRLVFDTDTRRLFVEHEKTRGDMRGSGYATDTDEMDVAAFLAERGQGQRELMQLLGTLFEDGGDGPSS